MTEEIVVHTPKKREVPKEISEKALRFWDLYGEGGADPNKAIEAARGAGYSYPVSGIKQAVAQASRSEKMREAFEREGVTFDTLAKKLKDKLESKKLVFDKNGDSHEFDDNNAQLKAFEMAAQIHDVFPSKKIDIAETRDITITITMETAQRAIQAADAEVISVDDASAEFRE